MTKEEIIVNAYKEGAKYGAMCAIDRACKWLIANSKNLDYVNDQGDLFDLQLVEDFKKYMEK